MARLIANDGFEIDLKLRIGIQKPDTGIIITLWKDGNPYLVPEKKSNYCDPEDYLNYRFMDYEYCSSDDFLPELEKYVLNIQKPENEMNFQCWPEARIIFELSTIDSNTVNIGLTYDYDFEGKLKLHIAFKKGHWSAEKGTSSGQKRTT